MRAPALAPALSLLLCAALVSSAAAVSTWDEEPEVEDCPRETPSYLGAEECKVCHFVQFMTWQNTRHARAMNTLKPGSATEAKKLYELDPNVDYREDPECLRCHTTGYGEFGGHPVLDPEKEWTEEEAERAKLLGGIQCEACHGPGSISAPYKKEHEDYVREDILRMGMVQAGPDTCTACHNTDSPAVAEDFVFDYEAKTKDWTKIHRRVPLQKPHSPLDPVTEVVLEEEPIAFETRGELSLTARHRDLSGDGSDSDLYGYLSLTGGRAALDDVTFHAFGRATYDLDRDADSSGDPFSSINDVRHEDLDLHLYEAFVDLRRSMVPRSLGVEKVRLGRQRVYAGFTYLLDGARVDFVRLPEFGDLKLAVFGGKPEFLYETDKGGDWLVGIDALFRPLDGTSVDLRYAHVRDQAFWLTGDEQDDYASITVRRELGETAWLRGRWNTIEARTRDVSFLLSADFPESELYLRAAYLYRADVRTERVTEFDPFTAVLGDSYAYQQVELQASKLLNEFVGVDLGATKRQLRDSEREGPFNREFTRGWFGVSTTEWPSTELDLALSAELWDGYGNRTTEAGAELTWRPKDDLRILFGTYYSAFKPDLFVLEEHADATTWYLRGRWKVRDDFRLDARYEYETGDQGDYHYLLLGPTWSF